MSLSEPLTCWKLDMPHSPGCFIVGEPERATEASQARRDGGEMEIKAASGNRGRVWQRVRVDILYLNVWPRMPLGVNISISRGGGDKRMNERPPQVPRAGWQNKSAEVWTVRSQSESYPSQTVLPQWFTVAVFQTVFHHQKSTKLVQHGTSSCWDFWKVQCGGFRGSIGRNRM